jgi:hypothetical protein
MAAIARVLDEVQHQPLPLFALPLHEAPATANPNRRSLPRIAGSFVVRPHDDGESTFTGVDLSFGGLMCTSADPVWPGNVISFDLLLAGETRPLTLSGRVVELVPHNGAVAMRLRFEGAEQAERKRIAQWMARTKGV